ncbi:MAG: CdaR family protein [Bacteroidales bacterium]
MRPSFIGFLRKARRPKDVTFRKQLYIFLICLGISLFIWILIKMSQDYSAQVNYRIKFRNPPAEKVISQSTKKITLTINAKGSDLFSLKYMTFRSPFDIDLTTIPYTESTLPGQFFMHSHHLLTGLNNWLAPSYNITDVSPDTLWFSMSGIVERKVPVRPDMDISYAKQYMLYDTIRIDPPEITVRGPESCIDTIEKIGTPYTKLENLDETVTKDLKIIIPVHSNTVSYSSEEVQVTIPVEKFTETSLQLPIRIKGISDRYRVKTFPETVKLKYLVALKDFKRVDPDMFRVSTELPGENPNNIRKLNLTLTQSPSFVKVIQIIPEKVDYIIMKP